MTRRAERQPEGSSQSQSSAADREVSLADFIGTLTDQLKAGQPVDFDAFLQLHPEHADELRELLPAMRVLADLDGSAGVATEHGAPSLPNLQPVSGVLGDYRLIRQIGRGGMGVVFEAEQISLGRTVALKVLPFAAVLDDRQIKRFKIEARAAAMLNHPSIVPVYSVGTERGVHYYAMRLVEGNTLAEVIVDLRRRVEDTDVHSDGESTGSGEPALAASSSSSVTLRDIQSMLATDRSNRSTDFFRAVARLGAQAADALEHAHAHGVLHRDIKPSNLMVDANGHLFITDFGLARLESEQTLTVSGDMLGTLQYMSPEQTLGKPTAIDHRTDIYSLGASLYRLLTLGRVFDGRDRASLLRQILTEEPRRPRRLNDAIPRELELIVLKAMNKNRDARYDSAGEMAEDLRCYLDHRPIKATPPTVLQWTGKWCWRHPTAVSVVGVALLVALVVGSVLSVLALRRETELRRLAQESERQAEQSALHARQMAYASDVSLASRAYRAGDVPQFMELLSRQVPAHGEPDVRGFEWHYLKQRVQLQGIELTRFQGAAYAVCCSPDGRLIAVAGADSIVRILTTASMRIDAELATQQREINGIGFSTDGRVIATAGDDGTLCLWNLETRQRVRRIEVGEDELYQALFTPDGGRLITCGSDQVIRLWDVESGAACGQLTGHSGAVESMALSRDGHFLLSAGADQKMIVWDLHSNQIAWSRETHREALSAVAMSPDGRWCVTGSIDRSFILWDCANREPVRQVFCVDQVQCVAFGPDGQLLAIGDRGGTVHLWQRTVWPHDVAGGINVERAGAGYIQHVGMFHAHQGRVYGLAFLSDGRQLVSVGQDGVVNSWSVASSGGAATLAFGGSPTRDFAFVGDGHQLVVATVSAIYLIDAAVGRILEKLPSSSGPWCQLAASPNGWRLAAHARDGSICIWDCAAARIVNRLVLDERDALPAVTLSGNGRLLAVATWDDPADTVSLIDAATRAQWRSFPAEAACAVAFSRDGQLLAADSQNDVCVWEVANGRLVHRLRGHVSTIRAIAFSPDGKSLATAGNDRQIILWDVATGAQRFNLRGHRDEVWTLAFAPDGRSLATAGADGTLRVWHVATGRELLPLVQLPQAILRVVFSRDGQYLAYRSNDTRIGLISLGVTSAPK